MRNLLVSNRLILTFFFSRNSICPHLPNTLPFTTVVFIFPSPSSLRFLAIKSEEKMGLFPAESDKKEMESGRRK